MMRALTALWALVLVLALPAAAAAQDSAMLLADKVLVEGNDRLIAEGNVEVIHGGARLTASRITYARTGGGQLSIEGPIVLRSGDGSVVLADAAALDADLRNGLLSGARLVLDQQVQLAAAEMNRAGGRYTQLYKAAATSCRICEGAGPPIWQIRARRVIHDEQERQLYFEGAQLRVLDVPVVWLPRLRLPDPTLERASGFLVPSLRTSSQLGTGLRVPYFLRLGDHADLTLTPYLSPETRTLELRYRQAFTSGRLRFEAAASRDRLRPGRTRAYLFGSGNFDFAGGYKLSFDVETVNGPAYLLDYGYSDKDRLDSAIELSRTRRDSSFSAGLIHYETLRDSEANATQPTIIADLLSQRRLPAFGGELRVSAAAHTHYRYSDEDIEGRDVTRANASALWLGRWVLGPGIEARAQAGAFADFFSVDQDSSSDALTAALTPAAQAVLQWPLERRGSRGARERLVPSVQLAWSGSYGAGLPNDESTRVEFDEGNLLALSRFPQADRRQEGWRGAAGLSWTRLTPSGASVALSAGRVIEAEEDASFTRASGLDGTVSDWLIAGQVLPGGTGPASGLSLTARGLFDEELDFRKAETRLARRGTRFDIGASYVWLVADPGEDRAQAFSEWTLDGTWRINPYWTARANWRYDVVSEKTARAGIGVRYGNECIDINFSASRRFTSSGTVEPSTDYGLTVGLRGFGATRSGAAPLRSCGR